MTRRPPLRKPGAAASPAAPAALPSAFPSLKEWQAALGLLFLLFLVFYFRLLFGMSYLWEDVIEQHYPNIVHTLASLKNGEFPFWTPYVFGGMPYLADMQTGLFYPPNWVLFLLHFFTEPGGIVFIWFILLHILVLGAGTYFLARSFGLSLHPALFCSVCLMFCGFISTHVIHIILLYVIAWFPFAFLFLKKSFETGKLRHLALATLFSGFSILGGYAQYTLFCFCILGAFFLFHLFESRGLGLKGLARPCLFFALFCVFSFGLSAVQLASTFELSAESVRAQMTFEESSAGSLSFNNLLTFLAPKYYGAVSGLSGSTFRGGGMHLFWETALFIGVTPLVILLTAFPGLVRRDRLFLFWMILGILALLSAFGANGPLYRLLFKFPLFSQFRHPGRFAIIFSFCFSMASAMALEHLISIARDQAAETAKALKACLMTGGSLAAVLLLSLSGPEEARQAVLWGVFSLAAAIGLVTLLLRKGPRPIFLMPLVLFLFIELFLFGHLFGCGRMTGKDVYPPDPRLDAIREEIAASPFRLQGRIFEGPGKGIRLFPHLNMGNVYRIPLVEGYNQLHLKRLSRFLHEINPGKGMDLFNVRYRPHPSGRGFYTAPADSFCQRFSLRSRIVAADSGGEAVRIINSPAFNPLLDAVVESPPVLAMDSSLAQEALGSVRILKYGAHEIELEVAASANAMLFASEVWYPAWKARLDGKEAFIHKANFLFRGVEIPAGRHTVGFYYQSGAFRKGALISLLCLALVLLSLFLPGRRRAAP